MSDKRKRWFAVLLIALAVAAGLTAFILSRRGSESGDAYDKISRGAPVNILILGDSIGAGSGASDPEYAWDARLQKHLASAWHTKAVVTNPSLGGESALAGYVMLLQEEPSKVSYDLVFLCFGENDAEEDFALRYEALIRRALTQYPGCSLIAIQEHSQQDYTPKMQNIRKLADYYQIPVVDTIRPFQEHPSGYDALTVDGCHPNDLGYEVFAGAVEEILDEEVRKAAAAEESVTAQNGSLKSPLDPAVSAYDHAVWFRADQFANDGLTFTIELAEDIPESGVILVINACDFPGMNRTRVTNNGELIAEREMDWPYTFGQRHIPAVAEDVVVHAGTLSIEFSDVEQAYSFAGCGFIYE